MRRGDAGCRAVPVSCGRLHVRNMFGGKLVWCVIIVLRMEMTDMSLIWSEINFLVLKNWKAPLR